MLSNLLRAEWHRWSRDWFCLVCLAGFVAITMAVAMANADLLAWENASRVGASAPWAFTSFEAYGGSFLTMNIAGITAGWMMSEFVTGDLSSGAVKNLVQGVRGRRNLALSAAAYSVATAAVLVLVGMGCAQVACWFGGYAVEPAPFGELALWYVQASLCTAALAIVSAWTAAATGSRMMGMAVALLLGLGVLNTGVDVLLEGLGAVAPHGGRYLPGSVGAALNGLQVGVLPGWEWLFAAALALGVGTMGLVAVMGRRRLA